MRVIGLEPTRVLPHQNLNLARLPISPHPRRPTIVAKSTKLRRLASAFRLVAMSEFDPFEMLGLPRRFAVDEQVLRQAFLKASAEHHPDRFVDPIEQAEAVETMSQLTDSYRVLSDPELRARALLARSGLELAEDKDKLPPALLMEVMEVREEMEDAIDSGNQAELDRLRNWANDQRAGYLDKLGQLFDGDLDQAKASAVRLELNALRYMQRMLEQMPD